MACNTLFRKSRAMAAKALSPTAIISTDSVRIAFVRCSNAHLCVRQMTTVEKRIVFSSLAIAMFLSA